MPKTVTCASEIRIWKSIWQKLIFQIKIIRRICNPIKNIDDGWAIKTNREVDKLVHNKHIIDFIKSRRLAYMGIEQKRTESFNETDDKSLGRLKIRLEPEGK